MFGRKDRQGLTNPPIITPRRALGQEQRQEGLLARATEASSTAASGSRTRFPEAGRAGARQSASHTLAGERPSWPARARFPDRGRTAGPCFADRRSAPGGASSVGPNFHNRLPGWRPSRSRSHIPHFSRRHLFVPISMDFAIRCKKSVHKMGARATHRHEARIIGPRPYRQKPSRKRFGHPPPFMDRPQAGFHCKSFPANKLASKCRMSVAIKRTMPLRFLTKSVQNSNPHSLNAKGPLFQFPVNHEPPAAPI